MKKRQYLGNPTFEGNSWVEFNNMMRNSTFPEKVYYITQTCGSQEEEQEEGEMGNSFEI